MTTKDFIAKLNPENAELVGKLEAVKTPEDAYAIAKETGVTDDFNTFTAEMTKVHESVKELSEDDLDMVAGGATAMDIANSAALSAASALSSVLVTALAAGM